MASDGDGLWQEGEEGGDSRQGKERGERRIGGIRWRRVEVDSVSMNKENHQERRQLSGMSRHEALCICSPRRSRYGKQ